MSHIPRSVWRLDPRLPVFANLRLTLATVHTTLNRTRGLRSSSSGGITVPEPHAHIAHVSTAHATTWDESHSRELKQQLVGATISASNITDPVVRLAKQIISTEGVSPAPAPAPPCPQRTMPQYTRRRLLRIDRPSPSSCVPSDPVLGRLCS
jgi:hypothetical protein